MTRSKRILLAGCVGVLMLVGGGWSSCGTETGAKATCSWYCEVTHDSGQVVVDIGTDEELRQRCVAEAPSCEATISCTCNGY